MKSKKLIFILLLFLALTGCKGKTYTVTFDTLGGSEVNSITVKKGETIKNVQEPTKEGYLFVSWLKDGIEYDLENPITEDITLTANWIETPDLYNYYTVTIVIDGQEEKYTIKENETVHTPTVIKKDHYKFIGWFVGDEEFDFSTKITKDITIVAKYEYNLVTVTYDLDGGYGISYETVEKNSKIPIIPEDPTKPGYKFLKWTLNGKDFSFDSKITSDITLKAVWEAIKYVTVSFDTDGGKEIKPITVEKYSKIDKLPTPTKEGYTFKEWTLNNKTFNSDTTIESNITLKAIYEPKGE